MSEFQLLTYGSSFQNVLLSIFARELMEHCVSERRLDASFLEFAVKIFKSRYSGRYDAEILESVSHPNILTISIGPNSGIADILLAVFRKIVDDYNYALKQKYQGKVA